MNDPNEHEQVHGVTERSKYMMVERCCDVFLHCVHCSSVATGNCCRGNDAVPARRSACKKGALPVCSVTELERTALLLP